MSQIQFLLILLIRQRSEIMEKKGEILMIQRLSCGTDISGQNFDNLCKQVELIVCKNKLSLTTYFRWHLTASVVLNRQTIFHPNLLLQYQQSEKGNHDWVNRINNFKQKREGFNLDNFCSINKIINNIVESEPDEFSDYRIPQFVNVLKVYRIKKYHPDSQLILQKMKNSLEQLEQSNHKQRIKQQILNLFVRFIEIQHYNQLLHFFDYIYYQKLDVQGFNQTIKSLSNILCRSLPKKNWKQYLTNKLDEIQKLQKDLEIPSSPQNTTEASSITIQSSHSGMMQDESIFIQKLHLVERIGDKLLKYPSNVERISSFEKTYQSQELGQINQTNQTIKHRQILSDLLTRQQIEIISLISKTQPKFTEFIIRPSVLWEIRNPKSNKITKFQYRMPKGQNKYSKLHVTGSCNIDYKFLWSFNSRNLIYSFVYCLIRARDELQNLGIYYTDLKTDNFIKFGNRFILIDFDHAYLVGMTHHPTQRAARNFKDIIRMLLFEASVYPEQLSKNHVSFLFKGKEDQFLQLKKKIRQTLNFSSPKDHQAKIQECQKQCLDLVLKIWKNNHFVQIKNILSNLLMSNHVNEQLMDKQERLEINNVLLSTFDGYDSQYFNFSQNYLIFLDKLDIIYQTFSAKRNSISKLVDYKNQESQRLFNISNCRLQTVKLLTKQSIWDTHRPRYIFAFLETLIKKVSDDSYNSKRWFHSFQQEGQSYIEHESVYKLPFFDTNQDARIQIQKLNYAITTFLDISANLSRHQGEEEQTNFYTKTFNISKLSLSVKPNIREVIKDKIRQLGIFQLKTIAIELLNFGNHCIGEALHGEMQTKAIFVRIICKEHFSKSKALKDLDDVYEQYKAWRQIPSYNLKY